MPEVQHRVAEDESLRVLLMDWIWLILGIVVGASATYVIGGYFLLAWIANIVGRAEL